MRKRLRERETEHELETTTCPVCGQRVFVMYHIRDGWVGIAHHLYCESWCPQAQALQEQSEP